MEAPRISLNLLIDNKRKRVLFAEAGKDFVDFLLETFTLPVVTVTRFLKNEGMQLGNSLESLYESIENLSDTCILPGQSKDLVLKPKVVMHGGTDSILLPKVESYTFKKFYKCRNLSCSSSDYRLSPTHGGLCYACKSYSMDDEVRFEELLSGNKSTTGNLNLLKEGVTYMLMDDLEIMEPISADNLKTLLDEYGITDVGALEKKVVVMGKDECLKLLKAAMQSKTVLTDVFLSRPTIKLSRPSKQGIGTSDEMLNDVEEGDKGDGEDIRAFPMRSVKVTNTSQLSRYRVTNTSQLSRYRVTNTSQLSRNRILNTSQLSRNRILNTSQLSQYRP